ncbi:uncharacterized protein LOC126567340 [Anopheles maculipalpis]|uniref:uncharacterized protein LOC126567340 n=1 Tax=Anopheles maculipalpis TaxID=1496333 RepID=UPI002158EFB5|nr:uncharacterized protein LOC126567340 [Anopheles maculipalpis]
MAEEQRPSRTSHHPSEPGCGGEQQQDPATEHSNVPGSTKAAVHINGVAVDHFHQNSDVDEDRRSLCQNNDIQGFISYSSDSSMIELNLKFRKCACNENIINISKENVQQMQRTSPTGAAESAVNIVTDSTTIVGPADGVTSKEGKGKKLLSLNKDNLNRLVRKLNDTAPSSPSTSCTKCKLSLDVKHILKQIVSLKTAPDDGPLCQSRSPCGDESCSRRSALPLTIDDSMVGLRADDSLIGSSASPLPSPNSPVPVIGTFERRHSETVERRSIGIQHASRQCRKKAPLLRAHNGRSIAQAEEIIIISDEFRRQSLRDQQSIRVQKSPKKFSKSMESIDKRHPLSLSLRPVAIRSFQLPNTTMHGLDPADEMLTIVVNNAVESSATPGASKPISKSVDDMSLGPATNDGLSTTGVPKSVEPAGDDVELIFISDEFVKRKSKSSSDVIIVQSAADRRRESSRRKKPIKTLSVAGVEASCSAQDRRKLSATASRPASTEGRIVKSATIPVVTTSSPGAKAKNGRRKTTISNSNSFLTYEEPFSPETLENKDIGQLFADASIE